MSNEDVYATGLLNRALDPATQPAEIQAFLSAELPSFASSSRKGCG
jgi:hypothetical protein